MIGQFTVHIEHTPYCSIGNQWHYYLRARQAAACNMPGEFFYIGYYQCLRFFPACATYAAAFADAGAGDRALEGAEYEFIFFYEVKACPEPVELRFEGGGDVGEVGDEVGFALDEGLDLGEEGLVLFFFGTLVDFEIFGHGVKVGGLRFLLGG